MDIKSAEDVKNLYVGQTVYLQAFTRPLMIVSTNAIFTEGGPVENPVTLVTIDDTGRPHTIIVSAYCLSWR